MAGLVEVLVGLKGHVDPKKEEERIDRGIKKGNKELDGLKKRLGNPKFVEKAPAEVVAQVKEQVAELEQRLGRLEEAKGLLAEL